MRVSVSEAGASQRASALGVASVTESAIPEFRDFKSLHLTCAMGVGDMGVAVGGGLGISGSHEMAQRAM